MSRASSAAAVAGAALCCLTAVLVATWTNWVEGLARALMVGAPIAVGLYARRRVPFARFGGLLVGVGVVWFVATLSNSPNEVVYSVGRIGGWLAEAAIVYVVLAFPTGRLPERVDRVLAAATAALVFLLYLPTALLVDAYPVPTLFMSCSEDCPRTRSTWSARSRRFVERRRVPAAGADPGRDHVRRGACGSAPGCARRPP